MPDPLAQPPAQFPPAVVPTDDESSRASLAEFIAAQRATLRAAEDSLIRGIQAFREAELTFAGRRSQAATLGQTLPGWCWCGCGRRPRREGSRFCRGHDSILRSNLIRLEKGEITEASFMPGVLEALDRCSCCGIPIMVHESGEGPVCRSGNCSCANRSATAV